MDRPDPYSWTVHPEATLGIAALVLAYVLITRGEQSSGGE